MFLLDFKYVLKLYAYYDVLRFKAAAERTKDKKEVESREMVIHEDAQIFGTLLQQVLNDDFAADIKKSVEYL